MDVFVFLLCMNFVAVILELAIHFRRYFLTDWLSSYELRNRRCVCIFKMLFIVQTLIDMTLRRKYLMEHLIGRMEKSAQQMAKCVDIIKQTMRLVRWNFMLANEYVLVPKWAPIYQQFSTVLLKSSNSFLLHLHLMAGNPLTCTFCSISFLYFFFSSSEIKFSCIKASLHYYPNTKDFLGNTEPLS